MSRKHGGRPDRVYEGYIFDLDGTIYLGDSLLPGAARLISKLRELGKRVAFVSNNPTRDPEMYAEKLTGLGIPTHPSEVVNTVLTTTRWLMAHHPDAVVFPIGEEPLLRALSEAGIRTSDEPAEVDIVVASYDRAFTYRKLQIAFDAIRAYGRAVLIATNPDGYCPLPDGRGEPDAGAIVAAVEACTGVRCAMNAGKPGTVMLDTVTELMGLDAADCVLTGDRLYTDIRMAIDAGMAGAVVLTGETTRESLTAAPPESRPTYVLERIDELLPPGVWAGRTDGVGA